MVVNRKATTKKEIKKISNEKLIDTMLLNRICPQRMNFAIRHCVQNNFNRRIIMVKNFPSSIEADNILSKISKIKNTTFSFRTMPMNPAKATSLINSQIQNRQAIPSITKKRTDGMDAEEEQKTIEEFYLQLQAGRNKIFLTNIFIEFYAEDEKSLMQKQTEIIQSLALYKITAEVLPYQQKEGFLGVNPLGEDKFLNSANNIPSNTLSTMYPFSFSSKNDEHGLLLGETMDGGYFFLDLDCRTEEMTTGNYCIIGQSGQGKTWLQKKIISQEIFKGTSVFIIDPDRDYIEMIIKLGGTVINCASGK